MKRLAVIAVLAFGLSGCAAATTAPPPADNNSPLNGTATVFAAASLNEAFNRMVDAFEAENPLATIELNFGGSATLAHQIEQGAPADVLATADTASMGLLSADVTSHIFATNTLEIVVPASNPGHVTSLDDFADDHLVIALCAVEVPCGASAQAVLAAAGVTASVDTFENDVKSVLTKVQLDEVDAGLVYRTDVLAAGDAVQGIPFDGAAAVVNDYPIMQLTDSAVASAFIAFVLSATGQAILQDAGFGAP